MKNKHLPLYGIGPIYVGIILIMTILFSILSFKRIIPYFQFSILKILFIIIGILLIILGIYIWYQGAIKSKLDDNIIKNKLVTTGIYSYTRNPLYTAFIFVFTGILFMMNNLYLLILPFIYWLLLTILMKNTEEKWLKDLYGKEYIDYCKRVNRCIPIKKKKSGD